MGNFGAIGAVGQAVLGLLEQARPRPEFDEARFRLFQASDFKTGMDLGVSLFLFRVETSQVRRNLPGRVDPDGRVRRRPLPLDLHFLLTPWARSAYGQHRLLGFCMRALEDNSTLDAAFLNHYGRPEPDTFFPDETCTVMPEPLSVQDMLNVWEVAKQNFQVSVAYLMRLVVIDSAISDDAAAPVQTRVMQAARP